MRTILILTTLGFVALGPVYMGVATAPAPAPETSRVITFRRVCTKNIPPDVVCELFSVMGDSLIIEKGDSCSTAFTVIRRNRERSSWSGLKRNGGRV
jgi:hypothetical protein